MLSVLAFGLGLRDPVHHVLAEKVALGLGEACKEIEQKARIDLPQSIKLAFCLRRAN
jgi:hypothetical protein